MPSLQVFSDILALLALASVGIMIASMKAYVFLPSTRAFFLAIRPKTYILLALLVALVSTLMSLTYSNWYELGICSLCYYQRMGMYPLVALLVVMWYRVDMKAFAYVLPLVLFGFAVALFHYVGHVQAFVFGVTDASILPCTAYGLIPSCTKTYVISMGFVTIPLMAAFAFLLIGGSLLGAFLSHKKS